MNIITNGHWSLKCIRLARMHSVLFGAIHNFLYKKEFRQLMKMTNTGWLLECD